jgi:hypothetical protein
MPQSKSGSRKQVSADLFAVQRVAFSHATQSTEIRFSEFGSSPIDKDSDWSP